jgi:predicted Zn-dependent protease with MMP-like domain
MDADGIRWGRFIVCTSLSTLGGMLTLSALSVGAGPVTLALGLGTLLFLIGALSALPDEEEAEPRLWGQDGARWSLSDDEFEHLVQDVELRGHAPTAGEVHDDDFAAIVSEAIEDLPDWVRDEIGRNVSVLVGDDGDQPERYWHPEATGLYGLYHPSETGPDWRTGARIIIFRDTLLRDFGHDAGALRHQITQTVRHEVAHHFGADERRVQELGL